MAMLVLAMLVLGRPGEINVETCAAPWRDMHF